MYLRMTAEVVLYKRPHTSHPTRVCTHAHTHIQSPFLTQSKLEFFLTPQPVDGRESWVA